MPTIYHAPLEPLKARYTEYLGNIEHQAFLREFGAVQTYSGQAVSTVIRKGKVLDSTNRPLYALSQITEMLQNPPVAGCPVYFSDFFTPGLEALRYAGINNPFYTFLWAQTFDRYDFTMEMIEWMRPWEHAAFAIYDKVFVASELLADLITTAMPHVAGKLEVVGLPFNSVHVASLLSPEDIPSEAYDCVYSSRFDQEKNPDFFLSVVEACPEKTFVICTGHEELYGNDHEAIFRAKQMAARPQSNLTIRTGLNRSQYYGILRVAKTQFNCALQDWVSFTLLEALTFECIPVYPMHRSFPEALAYDGELLYHPRDLGDAVNCLLSNLARESFPQKLSSLLIPHNSALPMIAKTIHAHSASLKG